MTKRIIYSKTGDRPSWYDRYLRTVRWKTTRFDFLKSRNFRCEFDACRKRATVVHHLTYDNIGKERAEDLMALCRDHHEYMHRLPFHLEPANDNQLELFASNFG